MYDKILFKLPQDVHQVAKVSKILQLMEKGNAAQFKNKSLDEIEINMEYVEENEIPETTNTEKSDYRDFVCFYTHRLINKGGQIQYFKKY